MEQIQTILDSLGIENLGQALLYLFYGGLGITALVILVRFWNSSENNLEDKLRRRFQDLFMVVILSGTLVISIIMASHYASISPILTLVPIVLGLQVFFNILSPYAAFKQAKEANYPEGEDEEDNIQKDNAFGIFNYMTVGDGRRFLFRRGPYKSIQGRTILYRYIEILGAWAFLNFSLFRMTVISWARTAEEMAIMYGGEEALAQAWQSATDEANVLPSIVAFSLMLVTAVMIQAEKAYGMTMALKPMDIDDAKEGVKEEYEKRLAEKVEEIERLTQENAALVDVGNTSSTTFLQEKQELQSQVQSLEALLNASKEEEPIREIKQLLFDLALEHDICSFSSKDPNSSRLKLEQYSKLVLMKDEFGNYRLAKTIDPESGNYSYSQTTAYFIDDPSTRFDIKDKEQKKARERLAKTK